MLFAAVPAADCRKGRVTEMRKTAIGEKYYCDIYGFAEGLARMRSHGYGAIDYQEFVETETPLFEKNFHEFEKYLREQARIIAQNGLLIHQTHGPWRSPPRDGSREEREERFEKMCRAIEGTAVLGCKNMVIHPIMPFTTRDEKHAEETRAMNLEFMGRLVRVGREHGVVICYENMPMPDFSIASPEQILEVVKTIDDEYFKICIDTGHCNVVGASAADAIRLVGREYLRALHIHDNNGKRDWHWEPFAGEIEWEAFGRALYETGYEGVISLEVKRREGLPGMLYETEELHLARKAEYLALLADGAKVW